MPFVLALFYHRQLPPSDSLAPILSLHAPRSTLHAALRWDQRVQAGHSPSPAGYCLTPTAGLRKTQRDPVSMSTPSIIQYVTEPNDSFGQINPFLPARRRPTVDHSHVAGGAQRHFPCLRATMPPSLETMRGNWKNQFSNLSSLDTSCRSPLILVMRSFGTGVFPPSSIRT